MMYDYEWNWMRERTSLLRVEDTRGIVAYEDNDGSILAACVADSFGVDNCNVHICIGNPLVIRRGFLNEIARWLFIDCGRTRILGLVPSNNERARRFDEHIGFTEIARVPNAVADGVDYIVMEMHRDTCRWLPAQKEAA